MDIDAIKSKLATLQSTSNTKDNFWKPEPGKQVVRIVPYKHNKDNPFIELFFHYNLGNNKTYLSPMSFGRPDPVAEFADKLKSTGNKDEWIQGKRLEPKMRTFAPVIVRGKESEGVKFWGFGKTVYQELLGVIADPDYGDISDPETGTDIVLTYTVPGTPGSFPKSQIKPRRRPSVLCDESVADCQELVDSVPDIAGIFNRLSSDEVQTLLDDSFSSEGSAENRSSESQRYNTNDSVQSAFDKLMAE